MEETGKPQQSNMADFQLNQTNPAAVNLQISKDAMEAFLIVDINGVSLRDFSPTILFNTITNSKLNEQMVNFTVLKDLADEVVIKKKEAKPLTEISNPEDQFVKAKVATGNPMVPGEDGWVKFYHPHNQRVVIREDGSADYRNLEKYISIKQDVKIATLFAGLAGKPGKDVYGSQINAPSIKKPKITIGANITTNQFSSPEEPDKIFIDYSAACDGVLFSTDESVTVSPELRVDTNVGLSTGNINYNGTVNVGGTVEDGSVIECQGSLNVGEVLESTNIIVGKDLFVAGGIKAKSKGIIKIGGNLKTKFVENTTLEISGDAIIEGYILNSKIYCLGSVVMTGSNAAILGSEIFVMNGLSTFNLGSNAGLDAVVELGVHFQNERLFAEFSEKVKHSDKEIATLTPMVLQANNIIKQLKGKLDDEKKRKYGLLFAQYKEKAALHKYNLDKFEELKSTRFNQDPMNIVVKGGAFPGAVIKYRRQIEKITTMQTSFMMTFMLGQDSAPMTAINSKKR